MIERPKRFETLDCWRGIAATMVALFHLSAYSHFSSIALIRHAWLFVDFFFVLSGFVITHAYFGKLSSCGEVANFVIRRFGRLWPLHIAVLAVFVGIELSKEALLSLDAIAPQTAFDPHNGDSLTELFENIFLVQAIGIDTIHSWNSPAWSISTEFWAYIVFAATAYLIPRRFMPIAATVIALVAAGILVRFAPDYINSSFDFGLFRCLYEFFVGHLVYRLWASWRTQPRHPDIAELSALGIVIGYVSITEPNIWSMAAPLVFGFAVWVFAFEAGTISRLTRNRPFLSVGAWSYSIYMVHSFVGIVVNKSANLVERAYGTPVKIMMTYVSTEPPTWFIFIGGKWAMDLLAIAYLGAVVGLAAITYRYVEQPGRRFFNKIAVSYDTRLRNRTATSSSGEALPPNL